MRDLEKEQKQLKKNRPAAQSDDDDRFEEGDHGADFSNLMPKGYVDRTQSRVNREYIYKMRA